MLNKTETYNSPAQEDNIKILQDELEATNREVLALMVEMDKRVEEKTNSLRIAQEELEKTNSELMQLTLELEDRVEQRTKELLEANNELIKAKEKAEESDRLKTAFLQNMSHEIRTPMNGILGFTNLLKTPNLSGDKQKEFIQIIEQSGQRMLNIINDIIDLSKIEAGHIEISKKEVNINQLLREFYDFFKPEAEEKNVKLICYPELADNLSFIETDENKLAQILSNLLKNALKFTQTGSITFGYLLKKNKLLFYVQDTGRGITENQKEKVFERFIQGDMEITRDYEGAGLGLTITKAFVEKLGGNIWFETEPENQAAGKTGGTTFYFNIPYQIKNAPKIDPLIETALNKKLLPVNILIVEDDKTSELFLKELLNEENAILFFAKNGKDAVEKVKTIPSIQIVLMDLKMPLVNGFDSTRMIKEINPCLPVIAQSAYAFSGDIDRAKKAGCDDFISKPVNRDKLFSMINKHLSKMKIQ